MNLNKNLTKINLLLTGTRGSVGQVLLNRLKQNNINVVEGDIIDRENCINLNNEFDPHRFNLICHLGASSKRSDKIGDIIEKNIVITKKIFSNCSNNSELGVIFASANSIVSSNSSKMVEISSEPSPKDSYSMSKLIGENLLGEYINKKKSTIVRLPAIYGNHNNKEGLLNRLINLSKLQKDIVLTNAHGLFNNAVMLDDVVDFFLKIILNYDNCIGKDFLLAADNEMEFLSIANLINTNLDSKSNVIIKNDTDIIDQNYLININAAKDSGFKPDSMELIINKLCNYE